MFTLWEQQNITQLYVKRPTRKLALQLGMCGLYLLWRTLPKKTNSQMKILLLHPFAMNRQLLQLLLQKKQVVAYVIW